MKTNLLWKAKQYASLENCLVTQTDSGWIVCSTITGIEEQKIFTVAYEIRINTDWCTESFAINCRIDGVTEIFGYTSDQQGNWLSNGKPVDLFDGCLDIDLPLTPLTNTLPINRLQLKSNETQLVRVIYLDLLNQETKPVTQRYTRLGANSYKYENVPNDFEATITVDGSGFVVDYPGLFERVAARRINGSNEPHT